MADILLRDAVQEMRVHIRAGHYSDAFALGRHILAFFPKHIETYVLLAQASLESNDLASATDLYRRVLSADPENVVALAGMALLNETQEKIDEALWYLERAFEIQPSNDELRRELLRVREAYYGTAPTRLELTSGALARVYARQGQYGHAINEFRRLLRNDSKRYDARVALMETLYRAGRSDEAAQLAQTIMTDAPFSLKPNLILGALWTENAVPEGQRFVQRAHDLDPENRVALDLIGEQFAQPQSPRLPALGAAVSAPVELPARPASTDGDTLRAAQVLREIERDVETAADATEEHVLVGNLDAMQRLEAQPLPSTPTETESPTTRETDVVTASPPIEAEKVSPAVVETAVQRDTTLAEIATAKQQLAAAQQAPTAPPPEPVPTAVETTQTSTRPTKPVPTDAIAAAAAALTASIALDKTSQPAPTRRAHPAIPKVRPVIKSAQERLPAWLRLSTTPAQASVSFEPPTSNRAGPIVPGVTGTQADASPSASRFADDRPDWLVQAEAAAKPEPTTPLPDVNLPDWLRGPHPVVIDKTPLKSAPDQAPMPDWLRDHVAAEAAAVEPPSFPPGSPSTDTIPTAPTESHPAVDAIPDWLPDTKAQAPDIPVTLEPPVVAEGWTNQAAPPVKPSEPGSLEELSKEPPTRRATDEVGAEPLPNWLTTDQATKDKPVEAVPAEPPAAPPPPDSATMLATAREKKSSGDLKGAMDLYERVMHRRPNYLDQVIGDLQEINSSDAATSSSHRLLGEAYAMAGRFKESLEQYRIAMGK
jgi:tetratricopeptide (TPR) repeat protein